MPTLFFLSASPAARTAAIEAFTPKAVAQWLHDAPTANQALFSKELRQRIAEINGAGFGGQALFELAELLRPSVLSVQSYLMARVAGKAYPLDKDDQAAGEVLLALGREFGQMYSVLLQEFDAATDGAAERSLGLLTHRLVRCVSHLLLSYYCLHLKVPAWVWRDLHALYRLAVQKRKTEDRQRDEAATRQLTPSVEEVYVQTLLLGLADPYTLQGQEILGLYPLLEAWAPAVRLRQASGKTAAAGWVAQLDQDKPPVWQSAGEDAAGPGLDLQALDKLLAGWCERAGSRRSGRYEPRADAETSDDLLRYLRRRWSNVSHSGVNVALEGGVSVTVGFRATHALLSPAPGADAPKSETESWDATLLGDGMLCCEGDVAGRVVLGALLSFQPLAGGDRGLAVVDRVLLERLGGVVKFSLRKITGRVMPAGLQPAKLDPKTPNAYQRALAYVDRDATPVRSFVLIESLRQQEGSVVRLLMETGMKFVKLANRENIALGCARFECVAAVD